MLLWRLSSVRHARAFDGGFGLVNDGRWNTRGRRVTYCSTVPSLAALEKRVHVTDAALLPPQVMVVYEAPDDLASRTVRIADLPADWTTNQAHTQGVGNAWLDSIAEAILIVPSVVMPIAKAPDRNALINHRAANAAAIKIVDALPFVLDPRLFRP